MTNIIQISPDTFAKNGQAVAIEKEYSIWNDTVGQIAKDLPNDKIFALIHSLMSGYLKVSNRHWLNSTTIRADIETGKPYGLSVESHLFGQTRKPVIKYVANHLVTQWVAPCVPWDKLRDVLNHLIQKYGKLCQPASAFIYGGLKWFEENGWQLFIFSAEPGQEDFKYSALAPCRTYIIDVDVTYSTIVADGKMLDDAIKGENA